MIVVAQELTSKEFETFGFVIERPVGNSNFENAGGTVGWSFPFNCGTPELMLLETPYQGFDVDRLERHSNVTQTFLPAGGQHAVLLVAPASSTVPSVEGMRAFLLDGSKGYGLHKGVWHSIDRLPVQSGVTRWVMLTDKETQNDLPKVPSGTAAYTDQVMLNSDFGGPVTITVK